MSEGVITDLDGAFSIMASPRPVLMISYVGYRDVRYPMGNRKKVTIEMEEDTEYLDDVVVIGYGTQKKSDLTGNADLYVDWNIWDGLTLNLTGSAHLGGGFDDNYSEASNLRRTPESDSYSKYLDYAEEYTFTSTLSYGKKFAGKHDFHVMAGFEAKNANYSYLASFSNVTLHSFDGSSAVAGYNIYFIRLRLTFI